MLKKASVKISYSASALQGLRDCNAFVEKLTYKDKLKVAQNDVSKAKVNK